MDTPKVKRVDVCIVGAGLCGLNSLFVAARHLGKRGKVAIVDRRPAPGGMWHDTYDYVRLHQPHPMFTAGNIKWQWDKDRHYLATKVEVLGHLQHCLAVLGKATEVDEYLGWEYVSHEEVDGLVRTTIARDGDTAVVESRSSSRPLASTCNRLRRWHWPAAVSTPSHPTPGTSAIRRCVARRRLSGSSAAARRPWTPRTS